MQHSVTKIGKEKEQLSILRKESPCFSSQDFFKFANENSSKYRLIQNGTDLLVSTWFSGDLQDDYEKVRKTRVFSTKIVDSSCPRCNSRDYDSIGKNCRCNTCNERWVK